MAAILFTCPITHERVSGWVADSPEADDRMEAIECLACRRVHLVNPRTGKVFGHDTE